MPSLKTLVKRDKPCYETSQFLKGSIAVRVQFFANESQGSEFTKFGQAKIKGPRNRETDSDPIFEQLDITLAQSPLEKTALARDLIIREIA